MFNVRKANEPNEFSRVVVYARKIGHYTYTNRGALAFIYRDGVVVFSYTDLDRFKTGTFIKSQFKKNLGELTEIVFHHCDRDSLYEYVSRVIASYGKRCSSKPRKVERTNFILLRDYHKLQVEEDKRVRCRTFPFPIDRNEVSVYSVSGLEKNNHFRGVSVVVYKDGFYPIITTDISGCLSRLKLSILDNKGSLYTVLKYGKIEKIMIHNCDEPDLNLFYDKVISGYSGKNYKKQHRPVVNYQPPEYLIRKHYPNLFKDDKNV